MNHDNELDKKVKLKTHTTALYNRSYRHTQTTARISKHASTKKTVLQMLI